MYIRIYSSSQIWIAIVFSSDPPICVFSYLGFVSLLELHCIWQTWTAKVILYLPNQYYLSDPINKDICILFPNTFLCNGQYCWVFLVEMEYCAGKQSICVLHSKVFVWSIQKYLCNSFKTAFHQAWQGGMQKYCKPSKKKCATSWLDSAVHEFFQIWVKIVGFIVSFISFRNFSDLTIRSPVFAMFSCRFCP